MKKIYFLLLIVCLILINVFFVNSKTDEDKISKEVYEKLNESNGNSEIPVIIKVKPKKEFFGLREASLDKTKEELIEELDKETGEYKDLISLEASQKDLENLKIKEEVERITYSHSIKAFLQDSAVLINATNVWPIQLSNINITGIDETICVIDSGINFSHPDLINKNLTCIIDCLNKSCVENCSLSDDEGHGTHVAGIIAASPGIKGVSFGSKLIGVKVLNASGDGDSNRAELDLTNAIDWCVENRDLYNISILSMSLGTETLYENYCDSNFSLTWAKAINNATHYNISVIAATGNSGDYTSIASPACIKNVTAVGSVSKTDNIWSSGNRNNLTDLLAPGGTANDQVNGINSTSKNGGYVGKYGTSMAAPHVSGAFALIGNFFRMQNNSVLTPLEIQNLLNNTGKQIYDSSSGLNFSRIDIYSAIISLDVMAPNVNLTSPENNTSQFAQNLSLACSANDVQMSNLTLYIWNSSGIYNNTESRHINGTNYAEEFNLTDIPYGNYQWNCLAYDKKGYFSYANSNYTINIGLVTTTLNYPENNLFTNKNNSFNCSAQTEPIKTLNNITLYVWNSTLDLIYNQTNNLSGVVNSTNFSYNFNNEENYTWNCLSYNNHSQSSFANSNHTVTYDLTEPNITLINPENLTTYTSNFQEINFTYNVSDISVSNCSLMINNLANLTNSSINLSMTQIFNQTFQPYSYSWKIYCTDSAGNNASSSERTFTINSPPIASSSSGGGGGSTLYRTYSPTIEQISGGYNQKLRKNEKIKFTSNNGQHFLTINKIEGTDVNLTIKSSPINLILSSGGSRKLNLTSDNYYDLYVKLNSIENNKANITIQTIYEEISKPSVTGEAIDNIFKGKTQMQGENSEESEENNNLKSMRFILYVLIIILVIFSLVVFISPFIIFRKWKNIKPKK